MQRFLLLLFLLCVSLHANWSTLTETEPSTLIEGVASVITGHVYFPQEDLVVEGAEPLRLRRNYIGVGGKNELFPHTRAEFIVSFGLVKLTEPNGTALLFSLHPLSKKEKKQLEKDYKKNKYKKQYFIFDPVDFSQLPGASNTARGTLSARTNIKNMHVELRNDWEYLTLHSADGTKRRYRAVPKQKPTKHKAGGFKMKAWEKYHFYLENEELPNGNKIAYVWKGTDLKAVYTTSPDGRKRYAHVNFEHQSNKKRPPDLVATTRDGQRLEYLHRGWKTKGQYVLAQVASPQFPMEVLHYEERMGEPYLHFVQLPENRYFFIVRDEAHRVKEIKAPVCADNELIATHTFTYFPEERRTDVANTQGAITRYFWSEELRLTCIERYTKDGSLYNRERIGWGQNGTCDAGNLLFRTHYDQDNKPISSRSFRYEDKGDVEEEIFWGNLSGAGALETEHDGRPISGETYKKRFQYNERSLVMCEEEDNGKILTYEYLPGTNLCTAEFSYDGATLKRRHFTVYNSDHIAVREIEDDGITTNINDLTSVTHRLIKDISLVGSGPYVNLPQCIEEKYAENGREIQLKRTALHYTPAGHICKQEIYDANGAFCYALQTQYDDRGRPTEESNAIGQIAKSSYDDLGNKIFFNDFSNNTRLHMIYDLSNRLKCLEETAQDIVRVTEHSFDTQGNCIATTDFRKNTTKYVFDDFKNVLETHLPSVLDAEGQAVCPIMRSSFDAAGHEITTTDAKGNTTRTRYSSYGKPIEIEHPSGAKESFSYYLNGTLKTHIDLLGTEISYNYDVFDRETSKTISFQNDVLSQELYIYNSFHLIEKTDAEGHTTHYTYDGAGRKTAEELDGRRITYGFDFLGRLRFTEQDGLSHVKEYDLLNRVVCEKKQDADGTVLFQEEYRFDAAGNQSAHVTYPNNTRAEETFTYDAYNRLIETKDALGFTTTTTYSDQHENSLGQHVLKKTTIDALNNRTIETYDAKERLVCLQKTNAQDKLLCQEDYFYDANDNLSRQESSVLSTDAAKRTVTTRWIYDAMGKVICLQEACDEPEAKTTQYTYTLKGQLQERKKPDGIILYYTYDPLSRCTEMRSSDNSVHYTFDYNRIGMLVRTTDVLNQTINEKQWNVYGQLLYEGLSNGLKLSSDYDGQGRRSVLDLPDGTHVAYSYDPLFMRSVERVRSDLSYTHYFTQYDLAGNLLEEIHIDQSQSQYGFDLPGRRYAIAHPLYAQQVLAYDPVGNILSMQFPEEIVQYSYDDLYQLERETGRFAHDFAYDSHFNRVKKDDEAYTINALNQTPQLTYDANGNPVSDGTKFFSYDALDRLTSIEENGKRYLFTYDAEHRRLSKQIYMQGCPAKVVYFLYDGQNEIGSIDDAGNWKDLRILGRTLSAEIGAAVAIELEGRPRVPIHDLQGSVCMVIPFRGIPERYRYSAFGEEYTSHANCPWRFSSKRTDETRLVYYGRRYYSPFHGRWLTPDPLGFSAGINMYAFVSNDPLIKLDLYGLAESRWDSIKSSYSVYAENTKQASIGILHGTKDAFVDCAVGTANLGYAISMPVRAGFWVVGKGSFSGDWKSMQASNNAFRDAANRWMHRRLPADTSSPYYQWSRPCSESAVKGMMLVSGLQEVAKAGMNYAFRSYTSMRSAYAGREMQGSLRLYSKELKKYEKAISDIPHSKYYTLTPHQQETLFTSAKKMYDHHLTEAAHSFSKHATRHPSTWGQLKGSMNTWHDQAQKHLMDIYKGPGEFVKVCDPKTRLTWIEKRIQDGRGIRLNQDHTFKGFID